MKEKRTWECLIKFCICKHELIAVAKAKQDVVRYT